MYRRWTLDRVMHFILIVLGTVVALLLAYFRMPLIVVALAAAAAAFVTGLFL